MPSKESTMQGFQKYGRKEGRGGLRRAFELVAQNDCSPTSSL